MCSAIHLDVDAWCKLASEHEALFHHAPEIALRDVAEVMREAVQLSLEVTLEKVEVVLKQQVSNLANVRQGRGEIGNSSAVQIQLRAREAVSPSHIGQAVLLNSEASEVCPGIPTALSLCLQGGQERDEGSCLVRAPLAHV
eukprot:CAMPEP_0181498780 /NCGR_PEP_ID=MMETSP1110-20121109/54287_1 /TAXON_ID=174948 /ORGANISM="Symbiodinium sp., Strain CCMP421" /LENGTH=140 /DNA_ID=CAMNT_0023626881 /DNA_START=84 /DNA_END=506 /DNA_ORIENTATION=-